MGLSVTKRTNIFLKPLILLGFENYSTKTSKNGTSQETVKRGQTIAKAGNTGHVDVPQIHFELRHKSKPVDPMKHLKKD
ncbi:MAG: M23 family metallopeptidase [Alphaproteobacteria bacterium]|nr:M23 family metallopeptidase [Alphaproteobacteria bacterium]